MTKNTAIVICTVVGILMLMFVVFPATGQFSAITAEAAGVQKQLTEMQMRNQQLPAIEKQLADYHHDLGAKMHNVTIRGAADAFTQTTVALGTRYHVQFGQELFEGPLQKPTPLPLDPALTGGPTPPPTPPPQLGSTPVAPTVSMANGMPSPAPSTAAGFGSARDLQSDPWGQPLYAFAGSIEVVGTYPSLIATLQDLSRQQTFVRVLRATLCRADNDASAMRTLSVAFRLYGLPDPVSTGPQT